MMTPDDREAGIAALAEAWAGGESIDDKDEWWTTPRQLAEEAFAYLAAHPDLAHKVRDAIPAEPCRHDAKWIEDYTRWAVEMDRRNRGDAIPAEPLDVERLIELKECGPDGSRHWHWFRRFIPAKGNGLPGEGHTFPTRQSAIDSARAALPDTILPGEPEGEGES